MPSAEVRDPVRLEVLQGTGLLAVARDPATQAAFDRLTRLATRILGVPVALASLVDVDRQVFVGCVGLDGVAGENRETPISFSICQHVVTTAVPVIIGDARTDPRVAPGMSGDLAVTELGVVAYAGVPLATADGHVLGAFCAIDQVPHHWTADEVSVLTDLAASAMAEIELRRVAAENRAARATAEAAQQEADAARQVAVRADRAKSEFLATMSHEIRTPLNAITGYAELLAIGVGGPLTAEQQGFLTRLTAAGRHLLSLISDVLDLAKVDAGELQVAREAGTSHEVVAAALDLVRPQAAARDVTFVDSTPGTCVPYVGDPYRARQVLINLLGNAVKFTAPGGTVTVTCAIVDDTPAGVELDGDGPWARIRVEDTGVGIPAALHATIFEPFQQIAGEGESASGRSGTGLGLAISRRLARQMGGELRLTSTPGIGSTFTLWLPASAQDR